jgi:hypothetical protein
MSEYQYVAFRALDAAVTAANLKYMRRQSGHAEITPWSFDSEYDFGDFHGNQVGMLQRGYDLHLHYANFGVRCLMLRLPHGIPDAAAAQAYLESDQLEFIKDKKGPGGILHIDPELEPDELEDIWEPDDFLDRLLPLRDEILEGDLRPLYLVNLALASNFKLDRDEWREPPIPAGLNDLTDSQHALAELYGVEDPLIAAAAAKSPSLTARVPLATRFAKWIEAQPESAKNAWLGQILSGNEGAVRSEVAAKFRKKHSAESWPTISLGRTFGDLERTAEEIRKRKTKRKPSGAARKRGKSSR